MIIIRKARAEDIEEVVNIKNQLSSKEGELKDICLPGYKEEDYKKIINETDWFLVALDVSEVGQKGRVVGFLLGGTWEDSSSIIDMKKDIDDNFYFYIKHIAVDSDYLGRGIGKSLYKHIFDNIEESKIYLSFATSNKSSQDFHQKMGFVNIKDTMSCGHDIGIYLKQKESYAHHTGMYF